MVKYMSASQVLIDANAVHQISMQRLSTGQAKKVDPFLRAAQKYIRERLAKEPSDTVSAARLQKLLADVQDNVKGIYTDWNQQLTLDLADIAKMEAEFQVDTINSVVFNVTLGAPSTDKIMATARAMELPVEAKGTISLRKLLNQFPNKETKRVVNALNIGLSAGETTQQVSKQVNAIIGNISRANSFSLTKTAISSVQTASKEEVFKENDDVLIGYRYISTLDSSTTDICKHYDQQVFLFSNKSEVKIRPPLHYGCRSTTVPEINGRFSFDDSKAKRPSIGDDGVEQVGAKESYYTFLRRQPAEFQDEAFNSKEMGLIFRNSGMSTKEFSKAALDRFENSLTLDEMAKKNKKIMDYLNK